VCETGTRDLTNDTTRRQKFTRGSRKVRPPERNVRSEDENGRTCRSTLTPAKRNGRPADRNLTPAKRNGRPADRDLTPANENGRPADRNLTFSYRNARPVDRNHTPANENGRLGNRNRTFEAPKSDLRVELSRVRVRTPDSRWPQAAVRHRFATVELASPEHRNHDERPVGFVATPGSQWGTDGLAGDSLRPVPGPGASASKRSAAAPERGASPRERGASAPEHGASAPERGASAPERGASAPERSASTPERHASTPERHASAPERHGRGARKGGAQARGVRPFALRVPRLNDWKHVTLSSFLTGSTHADIRKTKV
jgi:hypothetical protein